MPVRTAKSRAFPRSSRVRIVVAIIGTVLVLSAEFALMHAVYTRGAPTTKQQIVAAQLNGAITAATPNSPALAQVVSTTLARLATDGVSPADLAPLRTAQTALRNQPDAAGLSGLRSTVEHLQTTLAHRARTNSHVADLTYIALLIAATFGWMIWFRRLVARHRRLEHTLTEQQALATSEQRLAALVRNAADVVMVCDLNGTVTFVTPSVAGVLGIAPDEVIDTLCTDLIERADSESFVRLLTTLGSGADDHVQVRMRHADGRVLNVEGSVTNLVGDPSVGGLVLTIRDVTARVQLQTQLTHQAFHDSLTGLANRQLFSDRLDHALAQRSSVRHSLVVLFCDLDEFKNINDSLGHGVGDQVLVEVARRTARLVRGGDTAARLGGDEFAVLIEDADLDTALRVAHQIQQALSDPVIVDDHVLIVRASIGLAAGILGQCTGEDVLRNADVAMYLAKSRGKGTVAVYDGDLHSEALERLELRADLQRAIRDDQLIVHYQPIIRLATGHISGFEALVRWNHPVRGLVSPAEFIPIAEQTGLIHALGSFVLRTACAAAMDVNRTSAEPLSMSVNVTAQQLGRSDFVSEVLGVLADFGLPPRQLVLEITESVLLQDVDTIVDRLRSLRDYGIRIAIDDFGTGYSSLAYLRTLPLDILKIDKAFVDRVASDANDAALTEAIVAMSRSMRLITVAEGVEDDDQAAWLTAARCTYGQGYIWSKPLPIEKALALLDAHNALNLGRTTFSAPDRVAAQLAVAAPSLAGRIASDGILELDLAARALTSPLTDAEAQAMSSTPA